MSLKDRLQIENKDFNKVQEDDLETLNFNANSDDRGYGPLYELLFDKNVEKIFVNNNECYIEKKGREYKTNITFENASQLINIIFNIAEDSNQKVDKNAGFISFKLKDNSKLSAILPPYASNFPILSIKKPKNISGTLESLVGLNAISKEISLVLEAISNLDLNVLISGDENSGKTTFLGAIAKKTPNDKRIVTIEGMPELNLSQSNVIRLYSENKEDAALLLKKSLDFSPERIVIDNLKTAYYELLEASFGTKKFIATIEGNSIQNALNNFEKAILSGVGSLNIENIKKQVLNTVDVVLQLKRMPNGEIKLTELSEIAHEDESIKNIFYWDYKNGVEGSFYSTGNRPKFLQDTGFEICDLVFDEGYEHTNSTNDELKKSTENIDDEIKKLYSYSKPNIFKKFKKK